MKQVIKIKLKPTLEQRKFLKETILKANNVCNQISQVSFENRVFNQFKLHNLVYHSMKGSSELSAQMIIRCISKVSHSYKVSKKTQVLFKELGAITYDSRILSYSKDFVSIWTVNGRIKVPFSSYHSDKFTFIKGEADLVLKKDKFYLYQTIDVPEETPNQVQDFIGVDFGQTDIVVLSDGTSYNSKELKSVRQKYTKVRASLQHKGTKGSKRVLKRLSGREHRFVSIMNHTISKQIVAKAKQENKGLAIEDLSNIRMTAKPKSKSLKNELNRWSFFQLRQFLTYKAKLKGVILFAVPPQYTSQMCNSCLYIGSRNGKYFSCPNCGNVADADVNAAKNIAAWGSTINQPEEPSTLRCNIPKNLGLNTTHFSA